MASLRPWGSVERVCASILITHTEVTCRCGRVCALLNPRPFWRNASQRTCPDCRREHRVQIVIQSRAATEEKNGA